jgi:chemotaxis protein methyltransferase CheR
MTATALATIRTVVQRQSGITMGADKDYLVAARLEPLLPQLGLRDMTSLAEKLTRGPDTRTATLVTDALTTNETLWFRDARPFELLRDVVIPDMLRQRSVERELRFWSAACSTGQEPYSLAILLAEDAARLAGWRCRIFGTDLSSAAIARAREARYSQFEVQRGLSAHRLVRHFDADGDGWRLKPALRAQVELREANLLSLPLLGPFDVVLCRNVLIYFDVANKKTVLEAIAARMRPGGWLLLGAAETVIGITTAFTPHPEHRSLYRRA